MDYSKTGVHPDNERFRIATFAKGGEIKNVYLLNPGDCFQRFGGSSSGLVVRKTASLIVSEISACGTTDTEFTLNDKKPWGTIMRLAREWEQR